MQQRQTGRKAHQRIEQEILHLHEELRTVNVAHEKRIEFENRLKEYSNQYKNLDDENSLQKVHQMIQELDHSIALEALHQAESEISKMEKTSANYLGLENIRKDLKSGNLSPTKARHEIKGIRHPL